MFYLHTFFYSPISLHRKHFPSDNSGTFVLQALAEEDSCLQHTLISSPFCPSPGLNPCLTMPLLTASQGFECLIVDFQPKYTWDTMKGAAFCLFSVPPVIRKLYNIALQHRYLACKVLPHVHRVSANQEFQIIIITIPKPVWAFSNISRSRMRTLDLQKMLYFFKR